VAAEKIDQKDWHGAMAISHKVFALLDEAQERQTTVLYRAKCLEVVGDAWFGLGSFEDAMNKYEEALETAYSRLPETDPFMMGILFKIEDTVIKSAAAGQKQAKRWRLTPAFRDKKKLAAQAETEQKPDPNATAAKKKSKVPDFVLTIIRATKTHGLPIIIVAILVQLQVLTWNESTEMAKIIGHNLSEQERGSLLNRYASQMRKKEVEFVNLKRNEDLTMVDSDHAQLNCGGLKRVVPLYVQDDSIFGLLAVWISSSVQKNLWLRPTGYGLVDVYGTDFYFQSNTPEYQLTQMMLEMFGPTQEGLQVKHEYKNPITGLTDAPHIIEVPNDEDELDRNPKLVDKVISANVLQPGAIILLQNKRNGKTVCYGVDSRHRLIPFKLLVGTKAHLEPTQEVSGVFLFSTTPWMVRFGGLYACVFLLLACCSLTIMSPNMRVKIASAILSLCFVFLVISFLLNHGYIHF
jgi:hypothetical protein